MVIFMARILARVFWIFIPHPFRSSGQFSSGICGRCGKLRTEWHL